MKIELLISAVTLLVAFVALYKAWKTAPADIAKKYQEIASQAADDAEKSAARAERFADQCDELETRLATVEAENLALKKQIQEYEKKLDAWQHGIELLVHQLKANNIVPVWSPAVREE